MLFWNFSAIISYTDGTWGSVEIREEKGVFSNRGEDISSHREVVDFFAQVGLTTKAVQEFPNINSIVFRFSATYFNSNIIVASGIDEASIEGNNIPLIVTVLQTSQYFADYFLNGRVLGLFGFESVGNFYPYLALRIADTADSNRPITYNSTIGLLEVYDQVDNEYVLSHDDVIYRVNRINNSFGNVVRVAKIDGESITTAISDHFISNNIDSLAIVGTDYFYALTSPSTIYGISVSGASENFGEHDLLASWIFGHNGNLYAITTSSSISIIVPGESVTHVSDLIVAEGLDLTLNSIYRVNSVNGTVYTHCNLSGTESSNNYYATVDLDTGVITPLGLALQDFTDIFFTGHGDNVISFIGRYDNNDTIFNGITLKNDTYYQVVAEFSEGTFLVEATEIVRTGPPTQSNTPSATYNYDDGYIYLVGVDEDDTIILRQYDLDTNTTTNIELSNGYRNFVTRSYIGDGLNDMYDSGNMIATNINPSIQYTHTQQLDETSPEALEDSIIYENGDFGPGSAYFTAYHPGLFALFAMDINIEEFRIYGELGADGSGDVAGGQFDLTYEDNEYTVYYKKVYNSGDPTVDHLIIIPKKAGVGHSYSRNTNLDDDIVYNIGQSDFLIYIVMSLGDETSVESSAYQIIAGQAIAAYISAAGVPQNVITQWYSSASVILSQFPDRAVFSDSASSRVANLFFGNTSLRMCYIGNNQLFAAATGRALLINTDGTVINPYISGLTGETVRYVTMIGDDIYILYRYYAVKVDLLNKTISQELQYNITTQENHLGQPLDEDTRMRSGLKLNDTTYMSLTLDGDLYIGRVTGVDNESINITLLHDKPSDNYNGITLIGGPQITTESIGYANEMIYCTYSMGYVEGDQFSGTIISLMTIQLYEDPTPTNLLIQHKVVERMSDLQGSWTNVESYEVLPPDDENQSFRVRISGLAPTGITVVRMKYVADTSDNWLYLRYD